MNKKSLGRGLDSLFSNYDEPEKAEKTEVVEKFIDRPVIVEKIVEVEKIVNQPEEISIGLIDKNDNQPRKRFDEKALMELSQSIRQHGIIQPLILCKNGDRYTIVAGERRFRAARMAGLKTVPAIVKEYNSQEIKEVSIIENLQREDLNPIESARAIKELIDSFNLTQENVAEKIGKSRPAVANTLRLLSLPVEVIKLIEDNRLSSGHARTLLAIDDAKIQIELANLACDNKVTVRELEKYMKQYSNKNGTNKIKIEPSLELKDFIKSMQNIFSTKVSLLGNDKKGRIYIDYYTSDDLDRIYKLISKL
ncbi:MAG: ParB/RepB/Spo0J family partition protein [Clostridia bacterium]